MYYLQFSLLSLYICRMWDVLVKPGDVVVDATCGNGHDTLKLANVSSPHLRVPTYADDGDWVS